MLADLFREIDETYFRPHPFTPADARRIASHAGPDTYALLLQDGRAVAYGMLRGRDEGYTVPSLGIAVRTSAQGHGLGRLMMLYLHEEARRQGAAVVRLRVHPRNTYARRMYEKLGYVYAGFDRDELVMLLDVESAVAPSVGRPTCELQSTLIDPAAPEWAAVLAATKHDFYHVPAYAELCARHEHGRACALHVTDGHWAMLLPLVIRAAGNGHSDAVSPYGYPGPLLAGAADPALVRLAIVAGRQALLEAQVVALFVRLHPLLNLVPPSGIGRLVRHGDTVSLDLTLPEADIWVQMRENHRRDIARGRRLGYTAGVDHWPRFAAFLRVYRETMLRRRAAPFYFFDDAYFDALRDALGDTLHLVTVERDSETVAAGLFVETNGILQYHLSGTADLAEHIQPTKLMIHFAALWGKERGDHILHLGGGVGGDGDSLMHFKGGFSPSRHPFSTLRMLVDADAYARLVRERDPLLDPTELDAYFPLYRR